MSFAKQRYNLTLIIQRVRVSEREREPRMNNKKRKDSKEE